MKRFAAFYCSAACLLSNASAMAALFVVFSSVEGMGAANPALPIWLCGLALCQLCLSSMTYRQITERTLVYICVGFFSVQLLLSFVIYGLFSSFVGTLIAIAMWIFSYYRCYDFNMNGLSLEKLTGCTRAFLRR